jgi:tetratricopeptide (TPR) repeat protein
MNAPRSGELLGERYVVGEPIGEGSSGVVFRARDRWTSDEVAVKFFAGKDSITLARREYELARGATYPSVTRALDVGRMGKAAFVVFELAEGENFDRALMHCEEEALVEALDQLLRAVGFIQARGLIHGDLKPENVRVAWRNGRPAVRLLDLGLARAPGTMGGGNMAYGAPESLGGAATFASDLFSVGVMAFEVLSGGALPFGSPVHPDYLSKLVREEPAALPASVRPALAEVVGRLLAKESAARYNSAAEVRAALRSAARSPTPLDEVPAPPPLLEREQAIAAIRALLEELEKGGKANAVIAGPARSGRTALLECAVAEARLLDLRAIRVSARDGLPSVFEALLSQAEAFGASAEVSAARALLRAPIRSAEERYARVFAVLPALEAVRSRSGLLIAVDDLDRADRATLDAVRFLTGASEGNRLGWLRAYGLEAPEITVPSAPLSMAGVRSVLSAMLPGLEGGEELLRLIYVSSGGRVGEVVEGVRGLVSDGVVVFADGRWRLRAEGIAAYCFGAPRIEHLAQTLDTLAESTRYDLAAVALHGGQVERAAERLRFDPERTARLKQAGLDIRAFTRDGECLVVASEAVRECIVSKLGLEQQRAIQRLLVDALARCTDANEVGRRAEHLYALGDRDEAVAESLRAADAAIAVADLHATSTHLERACRWGGQGTWRKIGLRHAETLAMTGNVDGALTALDETLQAGCELNDVNRARGRVLARSGRYDAAVAVLRQVPAEDGDRFADERFWHGWSLMMLGHYGEAERLADRMPAAPRDRARLGRLRGTVAWHRGQLDKSCTVLEQALTDARASGDPLVLIEVEQSLGTAERLRGNLSAAAAHYGECIRLARAGGFVPLLAKCLNNIAIVYYQSGNWTEAHRAWETMRELAQRLDAKEEVLLAYNNLALLFKDRGEMGRAERDLDQAIRIAEQLELARYKAMALGNRAEVLTSVGRYQEASRDLEAAAALARQIDSKDELLECGRRQSALSLAKGQAATALTQARAAAAEAAALEAPMEQGNALLVAAAAARTLGHLEEASGELEKVREVFAQHGTDLDRARVDLEKARIAAAAGQYVAAKKAAREAVRVFEKVGAERELTAARLLEEGEQTAEREQILLELLRVATSAPDLHSLLERVLEQLLTVTGAERGCVVLLEGQQWPRVEARKSIEGVSDELPVLSRGIADQVVASGRPLVLTNVGDEMGLASRESVATLGLKAALCAPLKRGGRALGILYVDSRKGPELVRFGLWVLDAASAVIVPALERLIERERESDRIQLLRHAAIDALETVAAVDASLDLLLEDSSAEERSRIVDAARRRVTELTRRSEGLLDLLRSEDASVDEATETVSLNALLGYTLDALVDRKPPIMVEGLAGAERVRGQLEPLAAALTRLIDLIGKRTQENGTVRIRAERVTAEVEAEDQMRWRPGQSAGRRFVRLQITSDPAMKESSWDDNPASPENLSLKAAIRVIGRNSGRLLMDREKGRLIVELENIAEEQK